MSWFETLTGCVETTPAEVRQQLVIDGPRLRSLKNGRSWQWGELETAALAELRDRARQLPRQPQPISVREVGADVQRLHVDRSNAGACFQVASQFNLLEMTGPDVTPERGVGSYELDRTQGPACAIAAGAGTIYRNYFALVNGSFGQTADNQIDCLAAVGDLLGNSGQRLWRMVNGYALPSAAGLQEIDEHLAELDEAGRDRLRQALRIGVQANTQVTLGGSSHVVTQAYCSAMPVAYSGLATSRWTRFATLILEAAYEATICAALVNAARTGNHTVYLTHLGGGAFGNDPAWIIAALRRSLTLHRRSGLQIAVVSYGRSHAAVQELAAEFP